MKVHSIRVRYYRPFADLAETRLGGLATLVGKNDVGKSNILRALRLFLEKGKPRIERSDVHDDAGPSDNVVIEVAFTEIPEAIQLEEGIETAPSDEMILDSAGHLRIRKTYQHADPTKYDIALVTHDFVDDRFAALAALKERELNERCKAAGIDVTKSGRGITNKGKREALRAKAREEAVALVDRDLLLMPKDDLWKAIESLLPELVLFESDTRLGVGETSFQAEFRPVVKRAAEQSNVVIARDTFTGAIEQALQAEVDKIFKQLQRYTGALIGLTAKPEFSWDKAVALEIMGRDQQGTETSLERRGTGMRRLLMVAFFQYLAGREHDDGGDFIFAVEEPENCLHPGLQRELIKSFRELVARGYQVLITSHSPVFAGASPIEDLVLVVRTDGVAQAAQHPFIDLSDVADELGIEPCDQVTGYNALVFVEGPDDVEFWKNVATKLRDDNHVPADFQDRRIGVVFCGGSTLKHWIDLRAMCRLNRRFGVIVDSDRRSATDNIAGRKRRWKTDCESQGGAFFVLRKREMENYLHPRAIAGSGRRATPYDDFTDMKALFGNNGFKVINDMSCAELLEMDRYEDNGVEHHEIKEIVESLLALADA